MKVSRQMDQQEKHCENCGRPFEWRKKWERDWPNVRFCSRNCKRGLSKVDRDLEFAILNLLGKRNQGSSICPSEAARVVDPENWKPLMELTRRAARRLALRECIQITQGKRCVSSLNFKGPIRLKLTVTESIELQRE